VYLFVYLLVGLTASPNNDFKEMFS